MIEIDENLFIGNDNDCKRFFNDFVIIHACKTCHKKVLGYRNSLPKSHPNYLIFEKEKHLYLNMVDMEQKFLPKFTHPMVQKAITFIDEYINENKVLIHCNQGQSRSPSIGLIYLAVKNKIDSSSYLNARLDFLKIYPNYLPGKGIDLYLEDYWEEIMKM